MIRGANFAKKVIPGSTLLKLLRARRVVRVYRESLVDAHRHARFGSPEDNEASFNSPLTECQVTKDYHRIEKGLALEDPRRPFGSSVAARISLALQAPEQSLSVSGGLYEYASTALEALDLWNEQGSVDDLVAPERSCHEVWGPLGSEPYSKAIEHMFLTRRSIRSFDPSIPIDIDVLRSAVSLGRNAPSVCNRQSSEIWICTDSDLNAKILAAQNGNSGFGGSVPAVGIVVTDSRLFSGAGERNQRWIDGGLFAMSVVYAMHSKGFATCMLNWSMTNRESDYLRKICGIPQNYDVVTLVAIGHAPQRFRVARSPRRALNSVLKIMHSRG